MMSEYHRISAWYNTDEWLRAYNYIYSEPTDRNEALSLLLIWKARSPFLPSGVESTLTLLQVHVQDLNFNDDPTSERILRLAYSSALMRFVNHMLDAETAKGRNLYDAAKHLAVPDWIVDLRHDTAHGNNLASLSLFRDAANFGFEWLRNNYWDKQKLYIQDYTAGLKNVNAGVEERITVLMNILSSLSICAHSKCHIKNLGEIPNPSMRQSIVDDLQYLLPGEVNLTTLKCVTIVNVVKKLNMLAKKLFYSKDMLIHMNKQLLGEDSLFFSRELMNFMGAADFKRKKALNKNYVQCFELLLTFLHTNNLFVDFIMELMKLSKCDDENNNDNALVAALWLSEIFKALKRCENFMDKRELMGCSQDASKTRKDLKSLYHHWFPNEDISSILLLDLQKNVPPEFRDINFIQPIISEYNPNLTYFVSDLLNLIEPELPAEVITKICNLAQIISGTVQKLGKTSSKIYTVDDLKSTIDHVDLTEQMDVDDSCGSKKDVVGAEGVINSIWKLAAKDYNWSVCPIGQLPWQSSTGNEQDLMES